MRPAARPRTLGDLPRLGGQDPDDEETELDRFSTTLISRTRFSTGAASVLQPEAASIPLPAFVLPCSQEKPGSSAPSSPEAKVCSSSASHPPLVDELPPPVIPKPTLSGESILASILAGPRVDSRPPAIAAAPARSHFLRFLAASASIAGAVLGTPRLFAAIEAHTERLAASSIAPEIFDLAELRTAAVLYRTVDASPERRRHVERYLSAVEQTGPLAPRSEASILRAILSSDLDRLALGEEVDDAMRGRDVDTGATAGLTAVGELRAHLSRALSLHRAQRDKDAAKEVAQALDSVHSESPFAIDLAEQLIDAGFAEGARSIVESPAWPWSLRGAAIAECRLAIAIGDEARAKALIRDLETEGGVDPKTLERYARAPN
jgi:hypothetical protein